jgi:purine-binding chemotaxis protein CheW
VQAIAKLQAAADGQGLGEGKASSAQYLTFTLGSRTFALGIAGITEIIKFGQVTPVPRTPAHIRGVINLRGAVLPVLDLNVYVGQPSMPSDGQTCIVVIETDAARGTQAIGLMVDSVAAVLTISDAQIEPPPQFGAGLPGGVLLGMVRAQERFIAVLDAKRAFSMHTLAQRGWLPGAGASPRSAVTLEAAT